MDKDKKQPKKLSRPEQRHEANEDGMLVRKPSFRGLPSLRRERPQKKKEG